jgi:hypothetical protein
MPPLAVRTALAGFAALALAVLAVPAGAQAAPATPPPAGSQTLIRGAHFSPDTGSVDVYLTSLSGGTSRLWLANVGYGDVSPYQRFAPGLYAVSMRPHGAAASTPAALSWTLNAQAGHAYTAAAVGMNRALRGIVLPDDLNPPASGHGLVRVIQAASRAPEAKVAVEHGPVVVGSAAFASSTPYASVPAGNWQVTASSLATPTVQATAAVPIGSGSISSVVVLDSRTEGITIRAVTDAVGAAQTPTGSIDAGGGGTAQVIVDRGGARPPVALLGAVGVGLVGAGSLVLIGRRRRSEPAGSVRP